MNVLVICANREITDVISLFTEVDGHSCIVSNDEKKGCDLAKKENFDLILLDVEMPVFGGYDVLHMLKNDSNFDMKKIVVFTSSNLDSLTAEKIESLGVFKLVRKPFLLDSLLDVLPEFAR